MSKVINFSKRILDWHAKFGRLGLPWQNQKDPYRVWLSEIMLQQTQVATVRERYPLFLKKFPNVRALAKATEDEVMAEWAGMGYYTRARNLWRCAKVVVSDHSGKFPRTAVELQLLPGIGKSTAAAIAAFCFDERSPILDGNVKRVLARVFRVEDPINEVKTEKKMWAIAESLVPKKSCEMPAYTQAMMDFGATACTRSKPICIESSPNQRKCVMADVCLAYQAGVVLDLPAKKQKKASPKLQSEMLLLMTPTEVLLERRPSTGIWGGLWTLPETEWMTSDNKLNASLADYPQLRILENQDGITNLYKKAKHLASIKHVFSHRILNFYPKVLKFRSKPVIQVSNQLRWVKFSELTSIGLPKPVKDLLLSFS